MHLDDYLDRVRKQLTAAAALGDERTRQIADALATTVDSAVRLALLDAMSDTAGEVGHALSAALGDQAASVTTHLDGDDVAVHVSLPATEPADALPRVDDGDATARITLRLSESLKNDIDKAAAAADVSVNAWLVRAAMAALRSSGGFPPGGWGPAVGDWMRGSHTPGGPARGGTRITGWVTG